jgi:hypothetical protein
MRVSWILMPGYFTVHKREVAFSTGHDHYKRFYNSLSHFSTKRYPLRYNILNDIIIMEYCRV